MPEGRPKDSYGNIVILGVTGAGKTTLARRLAAMTGRQAIDLDDHYWRAGWQPASDADFDAGVVAAMQAAAETGWAMSGNYSRLQPLIYPQAHTLVALDYHPLRIFRQLLGRTLARSWSGAAICNGNRETFRKSFLSRDSILVWFFKSLGRRRRMLRTLEKDGLPAYKHLRILRFTRPEDIETWLKTL